MNHAATEFQPDLYEGRFHLRFPTLAGLSQDEEFCEVEFNGEWRRLRFHDYGPIYAVQGLYETIFCRLLRCTSPQVVPQQLARFVEARGASMADLRVFDIGAGNGLGGETLQYLGTRYIVGNDIYPEAKEAVTRDRSWVYEDFHIFDLTNPPQEIFEALKQAQFNALTAIGALGFGDIPPKAFQTAYNLVADGGWIAFNIHERFLTDPNVGGFAGLIRDSIQQQVLEMESYHRYQHRLSITGEPLYYICAIGRKRAAITDAMIDALA